MRSARKWKPTLAFSVTRALADESGVTRFESKKSCQGFFLPATASVMISAGGRGHGEAPLPNPVAT